MILRPYQEKLIDDARAAFLRNKNICVQAPTGAGKTVIFTEMVRRITKSGRRSWIMVPRNELLEQASDHLAEYGIPHGRIASGCEESRGYNVHVVSKDTLIRRYGKIKNHPDILFSDECHIALDRQIEISEQLPETRIIGFSATPERMDGRGLSELYGELVMGPALHELVELGFLSNPLYYRFPLAGLDSLHTKGTEFDGDELAELFKSRRVYGDVISHYERLGQGRAAIAFCRNVAAAEETAHRFREAGHRFESIDGKMTKKQRQARLNGLRNGTLDGLTSADLLTYGVDVKNVKYIIHLRPTKSRALIGQMNGRGLRPFENDQCIIADHVNNFDMHGHPLDPYKWNFTGTEKRKAKPDPTMKYRRCPDTFLYCTKSRCMDCGNNKTGRKSRAEEVVDGELQLVGPGVKLQERPPEEKREYSDRIQSAVAGGEIAELLKIAEKIGRKPIWVYHMMCKDRLTVNVPLLHEIRKIKGYKSGWAWFQQKEIEKKLGRK
jgi:superfamily II DNA or RNA helicase